MDGPCKYGTHQPIAEAQLVRSSTQGRRGVAYELHITARCAECGIDLPFDHYPVTCRTDSAVLFDADQANPGKYKMQVEFDVAVSVPGATGVPCERTIIPAKPPKERWGSTTIEKANGRVVTRRKSNLGNVIEFDFPEAAWNSVHGA